MSLAFRGWLAAALLLALPLGTAYADNTVRAQVGTPLKAAQAALKAGNAKEALNRIHDADSVPNKTPYESLLIEQMRGAAAQAAGDLAAAAKSFEFVLNSGQLAAKDRVTMMQAIAVDYYKLKDYQGAINWTQKYMKEGGSDPSMHTVLLQSYYLSNDCPSVNKMLASAADDSSGRKPAEEDLELLRGCYLKGGDTAGYVSATEKLLIYYPKREYWSDLLGRVQRKSGFSDRLSVNVYRLRLATGLLASTNDYMEFAQLALQAGLPAEAKSIMDKGYQSGALGKGDQADRQQRLRDLVNKSLADSQKSRAQDERDAQGAQSGDDLVRLGLEYVYEGNPDKGIALIQQGIQKGNLKHVDDAKLALGESQIVAGDKTHAATTLKGVTGKDGTADLARLWILQARG